MRESRSYGSVRGAASNGRPYRDSTSMSMSTAMLSMSTNLARNPDERRDARSGNGVPIFH